MTASNESQELGARKIPTAVYAGAIATGLFAVAATATGLVTLSKEKDYENSPTDAEADRIAKTGKTFRLLTDVEIGAAIVSVGATAYFYLTAPKQKTTHSAARGKVRLIPVARPDAAGLSVAGVF